MESYIDNYEKNDKPEHNSQHVTSSSEFRDDIISESLSMNIYDDNRESTSGLITPPLTVEKNFDLDSVSFIDEFCFTSHDTLMDEKVVESSEVCSVTSSTLNYTVNDAIESAKSVVNDLINNLDIQTPETSTKESFPNSVIPEMVGLERLKNLNLLSSELFRNILKLEYFSQLTQDSKCLHENTLEIQTLEYFESIIVCQDCNSLFTCTEWHKYCIYGRPIHDCHFCLKKFYKEESLERHLNMTHMSDERPYLCLLCEERFHLHKDFTVHLHDHSDNYFLYKCEKCPSRFLTRTHLTVHMNNDHRVMKRLHKKSCKMIMSTGKRPRIKTATIDYINKYKYLNLLRQHKTIPANTTTTIEGEDKCETSVEALPVEVDSESCPEEKKESVEQETVHEEQDTTSQEVIISSIEGEKEAEKKQQVTSPSTTDRKSSQVSTSEDEPVISNVTTPPTPAKRRANNKSTRSNQQQRLAQNQSHQQFFLQNQQQYTHSNVSGGQLSTQFMLLPNGQIVPICATPQPQQQQGLIGVNASMGNQLLYTAGVQQQQQSFTQQQQQQQLMLPSSYQSLMQAQQQQQQQAQYQQQQLQALQQQQQSQYQQAQQQQQQQVIVRGANGQLYAVPLSQSQQLQYAQQTTLAPTNQPPQKNIVHQQSIQPQIVTLSSSQMPNNPIVANVSNLSSQSQQATSTTASLLSNQITTSVINGQGQNALTQNPNQQPQQQQPILFYQPDGQGGAYILSANVDQLSLQQQQQQQQQQFVVLGPGSGLGGGGTVQFQQNLQPETHQKYHQAQQQTFANQHQSIQQIHQQNNQELQQILVQSQSTGPFSVVYPAQSSGLHMQAKIISHPPAHSFACGTPLLLANTTQSTISNGDDLHQQSQLTQQQSPQQQNQIIIQGNGQIS